MNTVPVFIFDAQYKEEEKNLRGIFLHVAFDEANWQPAVTRDGVTCSTPTNLLLQTRYAQARGRGNVQAPPHVVFAYLLRGEWNADGCARLGTVEHVSGEDLRNTAQQAGEAVRACTPPPAPPQSVDGVTVAAVGFTRVGYVVSNTFFPVSAREFCFVEHTWLHQETGSIVQASISVDHPGFPGTAGHVRGSLAPNGFLLRPSDDGQTTDFFFVIQADINGAIPKFIVKMITQSQPLMISKINQDIGRLLSSTNTARILLAEAAALPFSPQRLSIRKNLTQSPKLTSAGEGTSEVQRVLCSGELTLSRVPSAQKQFLKHERSNPPNRNKKLPLNTLSATSNLKKTSFPIQLYALFSFLVIAVLWFACFQVR